MPEPSRWAQSHDPTPAIFWPCSPGAKANAHSGCNQEKPKDGLSCEEYSRLRQFHEEQGEQHGKQRWPCIEPRGVLPIELLRGELEEQPLPTCLREEVPANEVSFYAELMLRISTMDEKLDELTRKVSRCLDTFSSGPSARAAETQRPGSLHRQSVMSKSLLSDGFHAELNQMARSNPNRRVSFHEVVSGISAVSMGKTLEDELCVQDRRISKGSGHSGNVLMDWVRQSTGVDFFLGRGRSNLAESAWIFIDDPTSSASAKWFARAWVFLVGFSVLFTILQTVDPPVFSNNIAACFETTFDVFFVIELLVRYAVRVNACGFFASPFNLLNVAVIIPLVLRAALGFVVPGQEPFFEWFFFCCVPVLRLLTLLRRLQLFDLFIRVLTSTLEAIRFLLFLLLIVVLVFSSCLYLVEPRSNIGSLPTAMWFTIVTMTTVGYGDFTPVSAAGHGIVSALIVGSVLFMAMPVGVIGNAFTQVWSRRNQIQLASKTSARLVEWGYGVSDIPKLLRHFDRDSTGDLKLQEFHALLDFLHVGMDDDSVVELFDDLDKDGTGTINCTEFMRVLFPKAFHNLKNGASHA